MKHLYIFSGLGADQRVFQKLDFADFSTTFIEWIPPTEQESIEKYATRLLTQIDSPKPILIGLSFGGLMAVEIAKQTPTTQVILIASAKSEKEIPYYYRLAGRMSLHRILPSSILKHSNFITNWFFGAKSSFEKELLKQILADTDALFLKWAIDKVVRWTNRASVRNVFHIHGTYDRILPVRYVKCDVEIDGGGHFMTLSHAEKLSEIIVEQLNSFQN